jgi:hypothetical protein
MKKILIISFLLGNILQISSGQIEKPITKGNLLTGGSFACDIEKTKDYGQNSGTNPAQIDISDIKELGTDLYFGYFIINHLAIGLNTDISIRSEKYSINPDSSSLKYLNRELSLGPFIRYSTNSGIFIEGAAAIGLLKYDFDSEYLVKWRKYYLSAGIGYSLFVSKSVSIEPEIKYKYLNRPPYEIEKTKGISNGLYFSIGLQVYLNIKNKLTPE